MNTYRKRLDRIAPLQSDDETPCKIVLHDGRLIFEGTRGEFKAVLKAIDGKTRSLKQ